MTVFANIFSSFNWYGFLIASAMLIGICACYFLSKTRGYHEDLVFWVAVICIPSAIVGARLYYVIFDESGADYWNFRRIIGFVDGKFRLQGLAIYGGIIAAMLGSIIVWLIFKKKKNPYDRVSILQMFDLFFIFILFGQAVGRWGNFANKEAYGNRITNPALEWFPFAVEIEKGVWHQATFFYESILNLIGCGIMLWFYMGKRKSFDGFVFSFYAIWYGAARFFIEALRTDSLMVGGLRVSQIVSTLFMAAGLVIIATHIVRAKLANKKIFIFVCKDSLSLDYFEYEKSRISMPKRVYPKKKNTKEH